MIAKVHGYCIAGATQLASICDVTFVAEDTQVGSGPQLPLGAGYVTAFWAWHMGAKRAKQFAFPSGEFITGERAAELGLFNEAVPAEHLDAYVADYVWRIARVPKDVLAIQKLAANRVQEIQGMPHGATRGRGAPMRSRTSRPTSRRCEPACARTACAARSTPGARQFRQR